MTVARRARIAWVGLLAAALAAGATVYAIRTPSTSGASNEPRALGNAAAELVAPGIVEAEGDVTRLAFDTPGRVADILVHEGDAVANGQLLARLDDGVARAQLARTEAALAIVEARRDLLIEGAPKEEIRAARYDATAARAVATERQKSQRRAERLVAEAVIATAQVDLERGQASAAIAQAQAAEARYALVRSGARAEMRREAEAAVTAARADVDAARRLLAQTELRAPRAGTILRRLVEPGEQVTNLPPTIALTLADLSRIQLRVEIDAADLSAVSAGLRGYATAEAYGSRRFPGHIVRLARELGRKRVQTDDPRSRIDTRVLEVIFAFEPIAALPLGLRMDLHVERDGRQPTTRL